MTPLAYEDMDRVEGTHWWFAGCRSIVKSLLNNLSLPENPLILEAGCGTDGNLPIGMSLLAIAMLAVERLFRPKHRFSRLAFGRIAATALHRHWACP